MDSDKPSFCFKLEYAAKTVTCRVIMKLRSYDIMFDGRWMATIVHTDNWTWIQETGVILPESIIEEIGSRLESEYN